MFDISIFIDYKKEYIIFWGKYIDYKYYVYSINENKVYESNIKNVVQFGLNGLSHSFLFNKENMLLIYGFTRDINDSFVIDSIMNIIYKMFMYKNIECIYTINYSNDNPQLTLYASWVNKIVEDMNSDKIYQYKSFYDT